MMVELFPEGFEEKEELDGVEFAAYTDAAGEERLWAAFGSVSTDAVPADWEQRWREFHKPVRVGRLWVGPPWEEPPAGVLQVVIDPGRAFGTGGHPTTRLCLELLAEIEPTSLVDVGCGSGVIAVAAAKLGFSPVLALDQEAAAVEATGQNATVNGVEVDARQTDALSAGLPEAAAVVANVSAAFACALRPHPCTRTVLTSGYLESDRPALAGFRARERRTAQGWAADLHGREE
jgi:ribosomal protein L11 methyltransferase